MKFESYLELPNYDIRKIIAKIRCSDHMLEIEKGRHRKIPREERVCKVCNDNEVETEDHFLTKCKLYDNIKTKHNITRTENSILLIRDTNPEIFGKYLLEAFKEREKTM